jgi:hypothetical protein
LKYAADGTLSSLRLIGLANSFTEVPLFGKDITLSGLRFAFDDHLWRVCCQNMDNIVFSIFNPASYTMLKSKLQADIQPLREQDDTLISVNQNINRGMYDTIGKGSFATVYRVHLPVGTCAVKVRCTSLGDTCLTWPAAGGQASIL